MTIPPLRSSGLILAANRHRVGLDESAYLRALRRGDLVRLRRGVYCETEEWQSLSPHDRYLLRMRAVAASASRPIVFCGLSAAAVWQMPVPDEWPEQVHILVSAATGGRSRYGVIRHPGIETVGDVVRREGFLVTGVARTALDVALTLPFAQALGTVDWALWRRNPARVTKADLRRELARSAPRYRRRHAEAVIDFATDLSDSFGESMARGVMRELGFPVPELQVCFSDSQGDMFVDYYWRQENVAGEFDGKGKYLRPSFQQNLSPGERAWREKKREDRLRRQVSTVVRIITSEVMDPRRLAGLLEGAGIRRL